MIIVNTSEKVKPNFKGKIFLKSKNMEPQNVEVVKRISKTLKRFIKDEKFDLLFYYKLKDGMDPLHVAAQKGHKQNFFVKSIDIAMPESEYIDDEHYIEMAKGAIQRYKEFYPKEALSDNFSLLQQVKNKAKNIFTKQKAG